MSLEELEQLAAEIREAILAVVETRPAHFASNLGVVELTLALHSVFDFSYDRLVWDVGHQTYPHKLVTGRNELFSTIRTRGGLMGYPNPAESPFDLFMTGHAGCSISSALGLLVGDDLVSKIAQNPDDSQEDAERHVVAVIGDGSFANGVVFEGLNHLGELKKNITVVLNDNKMSICPRVGGMGRYLDTLRMNPFYTEFKSDFKRMVESIPVVGRPTRSFFHYLKSAIKAGMHGGMLFEELGVRYIGPVDGHDIRQLQKFLRMARQYKSPTLLHVLTQKGHGYLPAEENPTKYHAPPPLKRTNHASDRSYTVLASQKILELMEKDPRVVVITAAMCQGNKLELIREKFPERFFDVGICESHAVVLASGMAKSGMKPIVDIYSTFMQRAYDHLFQEISLQDLPVTLLMDRAGLVGADGPTHHGTFDLSYMRALPNIIVSAPADDVDLHQMLELATNSKHPFSIRYSKTQTPQLPIQNRAPAEVGKCEILRQGEVGGGLVVACGVQSVLAWQALERMGDSSVALVNARFIKPLDVETLVPLAQQARWILTIEEGTRIGGLGAAVLEELSEAEIPLPLVKRLGVQDIFIQHASRNEQLQETGLDEDGIFEAIQDLIARSRQK